MSRGPLQRLIITAAWSCNAYADLSKFQNYSIKMNKNCQLGEYTSKGLDKSSVLANSATLLPFRSYLFA